MSAYAKDGDFRGPIFLGMPVSFWWTIATQVVVIGVAWGKLQSDVSYIRSDVTRLQESIDSQIRSVKDEMAFRTVDRYFRQDADRDLGSLRDLIRMIERRVEKVEDCCEKLAK